jgi:hypothetical protein
MASTFQEQLQAGEFFLVDTLTTPGGTRTQFEEQVRANAQIVTRNFVRYGFRGDNARMPLVDIDPEILSASVVGPMEMPKDMTDVTGLFVTTAAIADAAERGPEPILANTFPQYVLQQAA